MPPGGVGLLLARHTNNLGSVVITGCVPGGPASRFDIRAGDAITKIDDQPVQQLEQAKALLHGEAGTVVKLHLSRGGVPQKPISIVRVSLGNNNSNNNNNNNNTTGSGRSLSAERGSMKVGGAGSIALAGASAKPTTEGMGNNTNNSNLSNNRSRGTNNNNNNAAGNYPQHLAQQLHQQQQRERRSLSPLRAPRADTNNANNPNSSSSVSSAAAIAAAQKEKNLAKKQAGPAVAGPAAAAAPPTSMPSRPWNAKSGNNNVPTNNLAVLSPPAVFSPLKALSLSPVEETDGVDEGSLVSRKRNNLESPSGGSQQLMPLSARSNKSDGSTGGGGGGGVFSPLSSTGATGTATTTTGISSTSSSSNSGRMRVPIDIPSSGSVAASTITLNTPPISVRLSMNGEKIGEDGIGGDGKIDEDDDEEKHKDKDGEAEIHALEADRKAAEAKMRSLSLRIRNLREQVKSTDDSASSNNNHNAGSNRSITITSPSSAPPHQPTATTTATVPSGALSPSNDTVVLSAALQQERSVRLMAQKRCEELASELDRLMGMHRHAMERAEFERSNVLGTLARAHSEMAMLEKLVQENTRSHTSTRGKKDKKKSKKSKKSKSNDNVQGGENNDAVGDSSSSSDSSSDFEEDDDVVDSSLEQDTDEMMTVDVAGPPGVEGDEGAEGDGKEEVGGSGGKGSKLTKEERVLLKKLLQKKKKSSSSSSKKKTSRRSGSSSGSGNSNNNNNNNNTTFDNNTLYYNADISPSTSATGTTVMMFGAGGAGGVAVGGTPLTNAAYGIGEFSNRPSMDGDDDINAMSNKVLLQNSLHREKLLQDQLEAAVLQAQELEFENSTLRVQVETERALHKKLAEDYQQQAHQMSAFASNQSLIDHPILHMNSLLTPSEEETAAAAAEGMEQLVVENEELYARNAALERQIQEALMACEEYKGQIQELMEWKANAAATLNTAADQHQQMQQQLQMHQQLLRNSGRGNPSPTASPGASPIRPPPGGMWGSGSNSPHPRNSPGGSVSISGSVVRRSSSGASVPSPRDSALEAEREQLKHQYSELLTKSAEDKEKSKQLKKQFEAEKKEITALLQQTQSSLAAAQHQLEQISHQTDSQKQELLRRAEEAEGEISRVQQAYDNLLIRCDQAQKDKATAMSTLSELQTRFVKLEEDFDQLRRGDAGEAIRAREDLASSQRRHAIELATLQNVLDTVKKERSQVESELAKNAREIPRLRMEITELQMAVVSRDEKLKAWEGRFEREIRGMESRHELAVEQCNLEIRSLQDSLKSTRFELERWRSGEQQQQYGSEFNSTLLAAIGGGGGGSGRGSATAAYQQQQQQQQQSGSVRSISSSDYSASVDSLRQSSNRPPSTSGAQTTATTTSALADASEERKKQEEQLRDLEMRLQDAQLLADSWKQERLEAVERIDSLEKLAASWEERAITAENRLGMALHRSEVAEESVRSLGQELGSMRMSLAQVRDEIEANQEAAGVTATSPSLSRDDITITIAKQYQQQQQQQPPIITPRRLLVSNSPPTPEDLERTVDRNSTLLPHQQQQQRVAAQLDRMLQQTFADNEELKQRYASLQREHADILDRIAGRILPSDVHGTMMSALNRAIAERDEARQLYDDLLRGSSRELAFSETQVEASGAEATAWKRKYTELLDLSAREIEVAQAETEKLRDELSKSRIDNNSSFGDGGSNNNNSRNPQSSTIVSTSPALGQGWGRHDGSDLTSGSSFNTNMSLAEVATMAFNSLRAHLLALEREGIPSPALPGSAAAAGKPRVRHPCPGESLLQTMFDDMMASMAAAASPSAFAGNSNNNSGGAGGASSRTNPAIQATTAAAISGLSRQSADGLFAIEEGAEEWASSSDRGSPPPVLVEEIVNSGSSATTTTSTTGNKSPLQFFQTPPAPPQQQYPSPPSTAGDPNAPVSAMLVPANISRTSPPSSSSSNHSPSLLNRSGSGDRSAGTVERQLVYSWCAQLLRMCEVSSVVSLSC